MLKKTHAASISMSIWCYRELEKKKTRPPATFDLYFNEKEPSSVLSPEVPRITATHPAIQVSVGGDATLECQATGIPPPLVHWFKGKLRSKAAQTPGRAERKESKG